MSIPSPEQVPSSVDSEDESVPETIADLDLTDQPKPEFEFTPGQERLMNDMGRKMEFVGMIGVVLGVLMIVDLTLEAVQLGTVRISVLSLLPLVIIFIGAWTRGAGREYRQVASTHQRDITHLMGALEYQARIFQFAFWLFIALVGLAIVGSIVNLALSRNW
jgi:hypothetical protein